MRIFPTTRMFNPVNRLLTGIGNKWHSFGQRWLREWDDCTVSRFEQSISIMCANIVCILIASLLIGLICMGVTGSFTLPLANVLFQAYLTMFALPCWGVVITGITLTRYIRRWENIHYPELWWTLCRAEKFRNFFYLSLKWSFIAWLVVLVFMGLGWWGSVIFNPTFFQVWVVPIGLLMLGEVWPILCVIVYICLFSMIMFGNYVIHLRRQEDRITTRQLYRNHTRSMTDNADEDEMLDCKLERLGI